MLTRETAWFRGREENTGGWTWTISGRSHYGTRARKQENGTEEKYVSMAGFPFERVNK